jgi:hypothetical protein
MSSLMRLMASRPSMTKTWLAASAIAGFFSLSAALPTKAGMVANYVFQNTLSSAVPSAPDLVPFATGTYAPAVIDSTPVIIYNFGKNEGLSLNTSGLISNNYTIAALLRFDAISSYRKILDFDNLSNDNGLYANDGQLNFYPVAIGGPSASSGSFFEVVLTRDSISELTKAYIDGNLAFSFTDSTPYAVISASNLLSFFQDDTSTGGDESSAGAVAGIRIFDTVLTDSEVASLNLVTPVPGPLPLLGGAAAFGWSRRLRCRIRRSSPTLPCA